jgi:DUF1009 family protein
MESASPTPEGAKLGILAGSGSLPRRVALAAQRKGRKVFIVCFKGQTDKATCEGLPHFWTRLGAVGEILSRLHDEGVSEILLAGPIKRPSLTSLLPDRRAREGLARAGKKAALGDDGLLTAIVKELEEREGFKVIAIEEIMAEMAARAGLYGKNEPDDLAQGDIQRGVEVARALGAADVGQSVVVQQGLVLGVEAIEGTDQLLARVKDLRREGPGGVLVKLAKPQQERRADLPTIGPRTVKGAIAAKLAGIAFEEEGALIVDEEECVRLADKAGLFMIGMPKP